MTERLIDAVCPHCGRVGTTVRVVLREDGHTKLSRRCTDCGGECIHTFDHDWLAAANNKKLRAENEKLRAEIERLREALVLESEVLASHQGSPGREWHSGGAWLYPGDTINVVRAPLPEMEAKP